MNLAAIAINPPKRPSFEENERHSGGLDGKPSTPDRHSHRHQGEASGGHDVEQRFLQRNSSERSIENRSHYNQLHASSDRSLGHAHVEFQPLMRLPPPYLYTCTVGRNRSGARYSFLPKNNCLQDSIGSCFQSQRGQKASK